jgi:hypothetical protein
MRKYILIITALIATSTTYGKVITVKGNYLDFNNKAYSVIWTIKNNGEKIQIYESNAIKGELILNKQKDIIKIIKYITYQNKIKKLIITNRKLIDYEIDHSLLPLSFSLSYFDIKKSRNISMHKFHLIAEHK